MIDPYFREVEKKRDELMKTVAALVPDVDAEVTIEKSRLQDTVVVRVTKLGHYVAAAFTADEDYLSSASETKKCVRDRVMLAFSRLLEHIAEERKVYTENAL